MAESRCCAHASPVHGAHTERAQAPEEPSSTQRVSDGLGALLERIVRKTTACCNWWPLLTSILLILAVFGSAPALQGQHPSISFPQEGQGETIRVRADSMTEYRRGAYHVVHLEGGVRIEQQPFFAKSNEAVLWIEPGKIDSTEPKPAQITLYLDGNVAAQWSATQRIEDQHWVHRLSTLDDLEIHTDGKTTRIPTLESRTGQWLQPSLLPKPPSLSSPYPLTLPPPPSSLVSPAQFQQNASSPPEVLSTPVDSSQRLPLETQSPYGGWEIGEQGELKGAAKPSDGATGTTIPPQAGQTVSVLQPPSDPLLPGGPDGGTKVQAQSFQITGRSSLNPNIRFAPGQQPGRTAATVTGGLRIRIGGIQVTESDGSVTDWGSILLEADRAVLWTSDFSSIVSNGITNEPLEIYLEGNIVFQQGQRVIYANRMYYNVKDRYGMVLDAEMLTPVPQYEGLLRLKADMIQQHSERHFVAHDAAITSSRLGIPRYWLQSGKVVFQDDRQPTRDPLTGAPMTIATPGGTNMEADARSNFVYLAGVPVFYWPIMNSNIERPSFYLTGIKFRQDSIFGTQAMLDWDLFQILGMEGPNGTDWILSTDYLSERGFAVGTNFTYDLPGGLFPGPTAGLVDFWGIQDEGLDRLGSDRWDMTPEESTRGRLFFRQRKYLSQQWEVLAEAGWISDRNFLEQYFEREWDLEKDLATALRFRRYRENQMLDLWGQVQLNDFFTETSWLPRADHYWLGQPILGGWLTWYSHTHAGYGIQRAASTPTDPADAAKFQLQPWEVDAEGIRAATRHEIDLPIAAGPSKIVPYLSGEVAYWGEDIGNDDLTRFLGQGGIRTSLPMWALYPQAQSRLFNVQGIAHKVTFESDLFYADASENLDRLPLYDPLDDNAQEHFRRRLVFNTFEGTLPPQFDNRFFAVRSGMQRYVTATSTEVAEDLMQARLGINQRWQTKRGRPGRERITDLMELDLEMLVFPNADRDNFGEETGGFQYDYRYHIGDRLTFLSDGYFDVFSQGLKLVSIGAMASRPGRGEWYVGLTSLEGPISSLIASTTLNYRMNDKWIATGGIAVDLGDVGNVGESLAVTRIGESFLTRFGIQVDSGRDNVSFQFNLEPRFLPTKRLGAVGGQLIPPAGLYGLE